MVRPGKLVRRKEGEAWTRPAADKRDGKIKGTCRMQNGQESLAGGR